MISLKLNQGDLNRIRGKLQAIEQAVPTYQWGFRVDLFSSYATTVATAIGTVNGRGGYPVLNFEGIPGSVHWSPLSPWAVALQSGAKTKAELESVGHDEAASLYEKYADTVSVWLYPGATVQDVLSQLIEVGVSSNFVGITGSAYASTLENGGEIDGHPIPKRPLFAVVNSLVEQYLKRELANPESTLAQRIKADFYQLAASAGWGSNYR
ncbi:hypothetical protein [Geobacter sp. SVR]|uniref:hypothetical protein n=1 Tax=Geobacter sp. SVR TaxID=2495594 RepID=UPI00143EFCD9|nr:hypothetical protein [Geobacter sp. SVR]BCS54039.1 hypothetical protein GSVR_23470 [Geobacter sp. SVR]GCF86180.1 hypothetical protein GSbR_27800 [Geobacter sp. SVR]